MGELMGGDFDDAERDALEQLLQTYIVPVSPEWAERWRNRYEQRAVKPRPWTHATILSAADDLAGTPMTGDDLHRRVGEMIAALEHELANSEFDRRGLFSSTILESDFRAWLGHALDSRRRPWFSIVQEAETASATRTDLRIELRGTGNAVVVVEIKLLHRWTYEELLTKFQSQLIDQYLLTSRVRHGIYLLVDLGKQPKKQMPDGSQPDGATLVRMLTRQTAALSPDGPVATTQLFQITPSPPYSSGVS